MGQRVRNPLGNVAGFHHSSLMRVLQWGSGFVTRWGPRWPRAQTEIGMELQWGSGFVTRWGTRIGTPRMTRWLALQWGSGFVTRWGRARSSLCLAPARWLQWGSGFVTRWGGVLANDQVGCCVASMGQRVRNPLGCADLGLPFIVRLTRLQWGSGFVTRWGQTAGEGDSNPS